MSFETIKAKADQIRNEQRIGGNTRERVAAVLDDINVTKADKSTMMTYVNELYAKDKQLDEKIDRVSASGLKGEAIPTTKPTDYNPIQYPRGLYEKWEVFTAGTYTNFKKADGTPVVVTSADLNQKLAYIQVTNGVAKLQTVSIGGSTAKKIFDPIDDTYAATMAATAKRYDALLDVNKGFLVRQPPVPEQPVVIDEANFAMYGGLFLQSNNTYITNGIYPNIGLVYNLDVKDSYRLDVDKMISIGNDGRPAILGIKSDGTVDLLLAYTQPNFGGLNKIDVAAYDKVSIQVVQGSFPDIKILKYGNGKVTDAKVYVDDKLKVIDYFLNPTETVWADLVMPRPNETKDAILNTNWQQYPSGGAFNGLISISDLPEGHDMIEIEGNLNSAGAGVLWLGGLNDATGLAEKLIYGIAGTGKHLIKFDRMRFKVLAYTRYADLKFRTGKTVKLEAEKDSVKKYIDNHISSGSTLSKDTSATIARPEKLIRLEFTTNDQLPIDKTTTAKGVITISDKESMAFTKFATLDVQGASSALYMKKNWTVALYNDEARKDSFKLRVGEWVEHSEFVFKSNWIDATHCRNLISNHIWEDIVQSRTYYPKRENEKAYVPSETELLGRFDSGALTHVDGVPAELYVNGTFYGIGNFNIGKKRENYDLSATNQNHIQLAAETHANFYSYVPTDWEIRNPKAPDDAFLGKINAWFASNALSGTAFKTNFGVNHDLRNAIDFYLLAEFIKSPDMYTKNVIVTSWDGIKFYFLPYDMDTTFGLQWDGASFTGAEGSIRSSGYWDKFYRAFTVEIKARYAELKVKDVLTFNNMYRHADKINKTIGVKMFKKEFEAWPSVPSNSVILTSYPQLYSWMKDRIVWLDAQYS